MERASWHDQWSGVDASNDPAWFIRFLDSSRRRLLAVARDNPAAVYPWARPGMSVLDVGCGTGELLHPLRKLLGESGAIAGVDLSEQLIAEARRRAKAAGVGIQFDTGNATALPYGSECFDVVTANALLQHLADPAPALAEMVRVLRPGGALFIMEQDWDSLLIEHSDRPLTRRIVHHFCDAVPNGWIARELPWRLAAAGLEACSLSGNYQALAAGDWADPTMGFGEIAERARQGGSVTREEQVRWDAEIASRIEKGTFHCGFTMFRATGTRPGA